MEKGLISAMLGEGATKNCRSHDSGMETEIETISRRRWQPQLID